MIVRAFGAAVPLAVGRNVKVAFSLPWRRRSFVAGPVSFKAIHLATAMQNAVIA